MLKQVILVGLLVATTACSKESNVSKCVTGASVECACPDGSKGAQVCKPDGTFGTCNCRESEGSDESDDSIVIRDPAVVNRVKASEAKDGLAKIFNGAKAYYSNNPNPGIDPIPTQFPGVPEGPTPPLGTCCKQGGKCQPDASQWESDGWAALSFAMTDAHYFSYEYRPGDPTKSFSVRAYGDLDCDGTYSTFTIKASTSDLSSRPKIQETNPTE